VPGVAYDLRACVRSYRRLRDLRRTTGATLVPGHDAAAWRQLRQAPAFYD
jgi:hypothetical protein